MMTPPAYIYSLLRFFHIRAFRQAAINIESRTVELAALEAISLSHHASDQQPPIPGSTG
jgi:hypothetical protein